MFYDWNKTTGHASNCGSLFILTFQNFNGETFFPILDPYNEKVCNNFLAEKALSEVRGSTGDRTLFLSVETFMWYGALFFLITYDCSVIWGEPMATTLNYKLHSE